MIGQDSRNLQDVTLTRQGIPPTQLSIIKMVSSVAVFLIEKGIIKHFGRDLFHWNYPVFYIAFNLWSYAVRKINKYPVFAVNNFFIRKVTQKLLNHWLKNEAAIN